MKLTNTLRGLIIENARFEVLYDKYVAPSKKGQDGKPLKGVMDFDTLKKIIMADPTSRVPENFDIDGASINDMDKIKVGSYTNWLLNKYKSPELTPEEKELDFKSPEFKRAVMRSRGLFMEDLYKVSDDLKKFEKAKPHLPQDQRDINKYTISSLFNTLDNFVIPEKAKKKEEEKIAKKSRDGFKHAGGEIVFEGNDWTMIRISDQGQIGKDAAIYYGGFHEYDEGESRWCTSSPGLTYFTTYIKDGPLYVIFPNDDKGEVGKKTGLPKERYQFHFPSNQYMDRSDRQVPLVELLNGKMSELKDFFKPEFAKGLTTRGGEKVEINYPESAAGKFIALYGFDELFDSLPENISYLWINNKSKEDIALDVPPTLTRFKNLKALMLQNIVRSLPNNIGELTNLQYLSLPENKNLTSLPESLINCPELLFISLKDGNPNVKIPEKLLETLQSEGDGFYAAK
jgi:Leucine-rich repeat (LRR) protein